MKERPILFSGPMVRAILEGRKTQTRRVYKPRNGFPHEDGEMTPTSQDRWMEWGPCPYGKPGDRFWVRETTCIAPPYFAEPDETCITDDKGRKRYVSYKADGHSEDGMRDYKLKWTPSIFVPKWACRLKVELTRVRVERLQEISAADALAEGVPNEIVFDTERGIDGKSFPVREYQRLWEEINGAVSWASNPWVWVVEFRKVEGGAQ